MGEAIETGSGEGLVREVQSMYMQCDPSVKMGEKHSKRFNVDWGMRQGCCVSPWLCNVFFDNIVKEAKGFHENGDIREKNVDVLLSA